MPVDGEAFAGRLLADERIVWQGRPAAGIVLTSRDWFLIPFSVVWCGFAIAWTGIASFTAVGFAAFGLIFVVLGLFFFVGRFFLDAWLRQGTRYALTESRVLILKAHPNADFTSLALDRLPEARLTEGRDGKGTIRFGHPAGMFGFGGAGFSVWVSSLDPTPQFMNIADARKVFDLVQSATMRSPPRA